MAGPVLGGIIGVGDAARELTPNELTDEELWSYVVANPISYEVYEAVADNGEPWPDEPLERKPVDIVAGRVIERTDNLPPTVDPLEEHRDGIANAAQAALTNYATVTSDDMAAQAEGAKNRLAELRLAADKAGKALYDPPYREYKRLHALWTPMVKQSQDAEDKIEVAVKVWREKERLRVAAVAAEVAERARKAVIARLRLAAEEERPPSTTPSTPTIDCAIAAGEPEPEPVVEPEPEPVAPAPVPVATPKPTYGSRRVKTDTRIILDTITDYDAVYAFLKAEPKVPGRCCSNSQPQRSRPVSPCPAPQQERGTSNGLHRH